MKKENFLSILNIFLIFILLSGCGSSLIGNPEATNQPTSPPIQVTNQENQSSVVDPCSFFDVTELQTIFSEFPLIIKHENGSCRISNQWDTKAITIGAFQDEQADKAIRWTTKELITGWNRPVLIDEVNKVLLEGESMTLVDFQKSTIPLYELIGFRSERLLTVGDTAFWIFYPEAFTSIIDVVELNQYIRISYFGFLPGEILDTAINMVKELIQSLPEQFTIDYSFDAVQQIPVVTVTATNSDNAPSINQITVSSNKIFFGDLCDEEKTTIQSNVQSTDTDINVFLVYRLTSSNETNRNWITVKMDRLSNDIWSIDLNAEKDFNAYQLVSGAVVEYGISVLYGIDGVISSPFRDNISVSQCKLN